MSVFFRVILTIVVLIVAGWADGLVSVISPLVTGPAAGLQFENSNTAYLQAYAGMRFNPIALGLINFGSIVMLFFIWLRPLTRAFGSNAPIAAITAFAFMLYSMPAFAFFETTDKTEAYTILPNESAFWIPDVGANKDSQGQMDSEDYLNSKKIALKRFVIPHQKLTGSGGTGFFSGWDAYVPTGRLIIVDRKPFSREWVDAGDRGTSKDKQGFPCQSKEGLDVTVGISIGVEVTENDSAKFLYHFGVEAPKGQRSDPQVIFTSVYYGRTVESVMDDVGRKQVQTIVCEEISKRGFDDVNSQASLVIAAVREQSKNYLASVGITLKFIGWADTFTFSKAVQDAVDRRYIAAQDEAISKALSPYADTIQKLAAAQALRNFGEKSDGKLPTTIVGLPTSLGGLLGTLLNSQTPNLDTTGNSAPPVQHK